MSNSFPLAWLRTGALYLVALLGTVAVVVTLLSLPANMPEWWLKVLDFPRVQTLLVALGCLVPLPLLVRHWGAWALALGLGVAGALQGYIVLPFSPLVPLAVAQATPAQAADRASAVRLLEANVRQVQQTQGPGLPTLVVGDLNDVSWARLTRLFETQTQLHSVRVGRGLYATFDAKFPFLRWPLDHVFAGPRFRVVELKRLADFGFDHFPFYCELALP